MTEEQAVKIRSCFANGVEFKELYTKETNILADELDNAIKTQIPKKVKIGQSSEVKAFDGEDKVLTYKCYPCPNCGKWIVANENNKYCRWCGQKLDWSE